jgi:hypothetical protein
MTMTDLRSPITRRRLFTLTAGGASALVLARAAHAAPALKPLADSKLRKGLDKVPGDLLLPAHIRPLAEKLLARAKAAVTAAVVRPDDVKQDKVAAAGLKFVAGLKPARAAMFKVQATRLQLSKVKPSLQIQSVLQADALKVVEIERDKLKARPKEPQWQPPLAKKIEFHLNRMKCLDETSDGGDSDEILLGGQLIEPNGNIKKLDRWKVSDDFDAGEARYFDYAKCKDLPPEAVVPPIDFLCPNGGPGDLYRGRKLVGSTIDLQVMPIPATYSLITILGEEDEGGFGDIIQDIYDALKGELDKAFEAAGVAAGAALGGALGSVVPGLGNLIGAAIGAALGWLLGEFIEWLTGLFDDDLIQARHWTIQLASPEMAAIRTLAGAPLPAPDGVVASPLKKLTYKGDDGKYEAHLHWRVYS